MNIPITPKIDLRTNRIFDRGKWRDMTPGEYAQYVAWGSKPTAENPVRKSLAEEVERTELSKSLFTDENLQEHPTAVMFDAILNEPKRERLSHDVWCHCGECEGRSPAGRVI